MLSIQTISEFLVATTLLALVPGPDNLFAIAQSATHGRRAGLNVVFGFAAGSLVHTLAVVLGVAALIQASSLAFLVLKVLGAAYLVYLAWKHFCEARSSEDAVEVSTKSRGELFSRGFVMNVTNPKVSLFFLAYLPQFVDPDRGAAKLQLLELGVLFLLDTIVVFGILVLLAGSVRQWLGRSASGRRNLHRCASVALLGLAARVVLSER